MALLANTPDHSIPAVAGYRVVEELYLGSRTAVYQAVQEATQQPVVLKIMRQAHPSFGELVQFRNQYTIAKNLPIPGIVQPLCLEPLGSGYALVMEDWGGIALSKYTQQQSLDLAAVLQIALQIAGILHALGQHQVVHKDIKPANILIHPESKQIKLIDFSIASLLPKETQEIQNPNILEGTLAYLAPEQTGRMNRGIDYRADFYSLGVTLYQLLTGVLPFVSKDPLELVHCHIAKIPTPIEHLNPQVPETVAAIVTKLMAKNAEDRYQSALGLKYDLEQCLRQWQSTGDITKFELGQRDLSDRFLISETLYGREAEVKALLDAFERVAHGAAELMLVAGFSGIGKTAVVNEVHKPIARQRGYFIKGKFDQFNRNIPLSAFVQALRDLMGQLLSESDVQLEIWRAKILDAVGENGQVLIEVIPELEQIIGPQSIAPELSGSAAQNRFNFLFQKFIQLFSTPAHPLVLFLDDLQWADLASLQLLKLLMNDNGHLLVLGAYRDNEVSLAHPFILTVEELKKVGATVQTLTLTPLIFEHVNDLVADTLNCSRSIARPLTELVDRKTQGNPFFITQFLKALHEDGHILFNRDLRYWECDISQVAALSLTDNVVEFMALQLQKLPAATQNVLKLAACIGNQFDLTTLAIVSEQPKLSTTSTLWKALQEGLIVPTNQVYKFFQGAEPLDAHRDANPTYRFLHDRIQQAAYSLIPEYQRNITHYQIGKSLLNHISSELWAENIFDIVNHLNQGTKLIATQEEKHKLSKLNLIAGKRALAATAYASAAKYFNSGIQLLELENDCWENQYQLTLSLYQSAVEAEYLTANFARAHTLASVVLEKTTNILDCIKVYEFKIQMHMAEAEMPKSLTVGTSVLELLGVDLNIAPEASEIKLPQLSDIASKPMMQDAQQIAVMQILMAMLAPAYIMQPELIPPMLLTAIDRSLRYGHTSLMAQAYVWYGLFLCGSQKDLEKGYYCGLLALKVLEEFPEQVLECSVNNLFNVFIRPWKEPLINSIEPLEKARKIGFETGDIEYSSYATAHRCTYLFLSGRNLEEVQEQQNIALEILHKSKQEHSLGHARIWGQLVANLLQHCADPTQLSGKYFDEAELLPAFCAGGDRSLPFTAYLAKCILSYLLEDYSTAITAAISAEADAEVALGFTSVIYNLYYSLSLLSDCNQNKSSKDCQQLVGAYQDQLEKVEINQKLMKSWALFSPENCKHKYELVEAERCRVLGRKIEAIERYDKAIAGAKANGYIQEEALANELAAKFYLDWNKEKVAQEYLTHAYYGYAQWGAKAKVQDLEHRYPQLLAPILQQRQVALSATETVVFTGSLTTVQFPGTQSSSSGSTSISATLDLASILKASQALSSEIQLDKLLAALLHTVLENAGADKGVLLMPREDQWFVEAIATLDQPTQVQSIALSQSSSDVSQGLLNIVKRNLESVVIVDATLHPTLGTDPYVLRHQPKSMLCTPILNQGKLVAILYLENQVATGAFTGDRVELLNLLCTQAAISLENARLYQQAQTYAQQLEQSQLQIVQSEKMASLGNLVAGVAHEINNPIGFLKGSIRNGIDYVQDLLEHLALYQQHYPDSVEPIQAHAEEIDLDFLSEDLLKLLDSMKGATDRIKSISTSLRTFSRADTAHKVSANLHEGIDSTLLILKYRLKANERRPAIEVIKDYGEVPAIDCFPGQLNQVFMNILANAIDMFDEVAQTRSFAELKANPQQVTIRTKILQNQLQISISDNGSGISEEVKAQVFDYLFTTKGVGKGTGLGLAIARQIVEEKHGGSLTVQSEMGRGTEFCIHLPVRG